MDTKHDEKLAFDTQQQAETAAIAVTFQHGAKKPKVYKCTKCSLWHLATDYEE